MRRNVSLTHRPPCTPFVPIWRNAARAEAVRGLGVRPLHRGISGHSRGIRPPDEDCPDDRRVGPCAQGLLSARSYHDASTPSKEYHLSHNRAMEAGPIWQLFHGDPASRVSGVHGWREQVASRLLRIAVSSPRISALGVWRLARGLLPTSHPNAEQRAPNAEIGERYGCGATLGSRGAAATEPSSACKPRRRRKSSSETTPTPTPNQSVQKRISSVATTALGPEISSTSRSKAALLASAAPSPPGRREAEPTRA